MSQLPSSAAEAEKIGSIRYNDGVPCKHGHDSDRYTQNHACAECSRIHSKKESARQRRENPVGKRVVASRSRAKKLGVPFDTQAYLDAWAARGDYCPALGIKFVQPPAPLTFATPEMDRIIPELGYVRGNIWVISRQANKMKNNGTAAMLRQIADAVDERIAQGK